MTVGRVERLTWRGGPDGSVPVVLQNCYHYAGREGKKHIEMERGDMLNGKEDAQKWRENARTSSWVMREKERVPGD